MNDDNSPVRFSTLRTASGHAFGRATLNAPASLNALSLPMVDLLDPQLAQWAADPHIAGVVLDAVGEKAFCAGGDVVSLYRSIRATAPQEVPVEAAAFFEHEYRLDYRIHRFPKPLLCWGHGIVMGGGIGLLAGASHRVATPRTRMAMPEITIGLYPDVGGSWILRRMPGRTGLFLALTGASLNAADARYVGLADVVLRHEDQPAVLDAIAAASWQGIHAEDAEQLTRLLQGLAGRAELPPEVLRPHQGLIDETIGHDGLLAAADRLRALATHADPWISQASATFAKGSPTSAALAFEMQQRTRDLSLADVFRLEWNASVGCCMHHDIAEGVRALLVDKDKKPRWNPATLEAVTPAFIESHLIPRHAGVHPLADLA